MRPSIPLYLIFFLFNLLSASAQMNLDTLKTKAKIYLEVAPQQSTYHLSTETSDSPIKNDLYQNQLDAEFLGIHTRDSLELKVDEVEPSTEPEVELEPNSFKNRINVSYLYINHDQYLFASDIMTTEYVRKEEKNTFVGRLNSTIRNSKTGFQGEIDWYHIFDKSNYFLLNMAYADRFFPKVKGGATFYHSFKNAWGAEAGIRYFYDDFEKKSTFFGVLGGTKEIKNFWLNLKFTFNPEENFKIHAQFQTRMYLNDQLDYASIVAGFGNMPEVSDLNFLTEDAYSVTNVMLGAGYTYHFTDWIQLKLNFNWYRYEVRKSQFSNQYHGFAGLGLSF